MLLRGASVAPLAEGSRRDGPRILIIQLRRIGDVLLSTPAIRAISERFPGVRIDFMAESPADEVLWGHPLIDRLLVAPRRGGGGWLDFVRRLRAYKYDWTIDFFSNPRSAQFAFLSGARVRIGLDRRGRRWAFTHRVIEEESDRDVYAVDLRLRILERLGVPAVTRNLEIYSDRSDPPEVARVMEAMSLATAGGNRGDQTVVAIAAGSANPAKRYPAKLSAAVIEGLRRLHRTVILTSGPGETEFGQEIVQYLASPVLHLANARVPTLAALYRHCHLYVGPDSSPKHIAVACGLPAVTIFGPGNPANWNDPRNPRNIVLAAPCDVRPHCREPECAKLGHIGMIKPEDVLASAQKLLAK